MGSMLTFFETTGTIHFTLVGDIVDSEEQSTTSLSAGFVISFDKTIPIASYISRTLVSLISCNLQLALVKN